MTTTVDLRTATASTSIRSRATCARPERDLWADEEALWDRMQAAWAGLDDAAWHAAGRRAIGRRRAGLVARRARRPHRRLAGAGDRLHASGDRDGVWPSDSEYDDGNFDTFNERRREPWASMPRDAILGAAGGCQIASHRGRATALPRDDPRATMGGTGSTGPARPLPRPPRGDRAVDRRTAPTPAAAH